MSIIGQELERLTAAKAEREKQQRAALVATVQIELDRPSCGHEKPGTAKCKTCGLKFCVDCLLAHVCPKAVQPTKAERKDQFAGFLE